jgi:hypothetical protein
MKNTNITDSAINNINRKLIYKFTLDGEELPLSDVMNNPTITYDCGLDQYSVGNLYIGELSFSVKNTTFVNYKSEIVVTVDIQTDSGTISTKLGKFYVDTVVEQGVTKQIKAYDGMFLLNVGYFPSAKHTTTKAIVDDIASKHNLTILGFENRTANINNEQIDGKTVLEMLQLVAGVHGGSIFMNGDGAVKFVQATDTGKTYTKSQYSTPTLDTSVSYNITKLKVIYGEKTTNEDGSVKDEGYFEVGEGLDSRTLAISNVLLKGQRTQAQNILNIIKNMNGYNRFDTTILLGDYRLEPMDVISYVKDDKTYKVPIIYMQIALTYSGLSIRTQSPTLAESKSEFSFKGTITQKIDNVYTEMMQVKDIVANSITVGDLEAINAEIENLQAKDATITNLVASKADITDLNAVNAEIDNLQADYAEIGTLVANKADISSLHATNAEINSLKVNVGDINYLMSGHITSGNIQAGGITSDRLNIDNGFIKDAMIDTVSASKILAGKISTGSVLIGSDDGKLVIADETIQITDGTNVRVQIGETANGDYAIVIYDEDGNVMFDATGITENAIKDAIIKDDMVADDANINGKKIDITSLVTAINEDGTSTINVSKLYYDSEGQLFEVVFNEMTDKQDTLMTELEVQKGQISTLVQNTTITTNDGQTTTLKDAFSEFQQTQDEINLRVEQNISNIQVTNLLKHTDLSTYGYPNDWWTNDTLYSNSNVTRTYIDVEDCFSDRKIGGVEVVNNTSSNYLGLVVQDSVELVNGETYTASAYFKTTTRNILARFYVMGGYYSSSAYIEPNGKWQQISHTFTYDEVGVGSREHNILFGLSGQNFKGQICGFKLERGSTATEWNNSTYDLEERISAVELKLTEDSIVSTVTNSTIFKEESANIASNAVSDINLGGKNLLKKSKDLSESYTYPYADIEDSGIEGFKQFKMHIGHVNPDTHLLVTKTEVVIPIYGKTETLTTQDYLTVSFDMSWSGYPVGVSYGLCTPILGVVDSNQENLGGYYSIAELPKFWFTTEGISSYELIGGYIPSENIDFASRDGWLRLAYTFKPQIEEETNVTYVLAFVFENNQLYTPDEKLFIRKPKLEVGNKASAWSQAPEDLEEDVAEEFEITYTKIEQNAESITLTASRTTANEEAISSLQVNADSINASVKEVTTTIDSITGELNTLTNKVEASMSSEDIKFLVSSEVANSSVGKVTTETGFTFDKDGLTISKSDSEMSTLVDEDGLTIYKNNDVMLDVNNQGVDAQNVNVKTYLIIGTNSRMENYLGNRTAIFFIGDSEL